MLPILDWRDFASDREKFVAELGSAGRDVGFFLLKNHTVSKELREAVFAQSDTFFGLPIEEKNKVSVLNTPHFRGWGQAGEESLDENSNLIDQKETYNIGFDLAADDPRVLASEKFRGVNQWPDLPGFSETMLTYYDTTMALGIDILRAFALDLGLEPEHFTDSFHESLAALRLLHYPPYRGTEEAIGAGAHTDYGAITLLMSDGEPGLQVKPRGKDWLDVPHVPDSYIVNIGDCMMRWTNDIYVSTPHRVLAPKGTRRSVAMFIQPNPHVIVETLPGTGEPKYPPVRADDYLMSRVDAHYPKPKE